MKPARWMIALFVVFGVMTPAAHARYKEPSWGRFTTRDSIGIWRDARNVGSGVAYVANNPMRYVDPFGMQAFDPRTSPVSPAPIEILPYDEPGFIDAPVYSSPGRTYRFSPEDQKRLSDAAQQACNRAQCALNGLDDSGISKHVCGSPGLNDQLLKQRLEEFIRTFCQGKNSPRRHTVVPNPNIQSPQVFRLPGGWYPTKNINFPIKDGRLPTRDLPGDFIHEPSHYLWDTDDGESGIPDKNAHLFETAAAAACNRQKQRDPKWKNVDTGAPGAP